MIRRPLISGMVLEIRAYDDTEEDLKQRVADRLSGNERHNVRLGVNSYEYTINGPLRLTLMCSNEYVQTVVTNRRPMLLHTGVVSHETLKLSLVGSVVHKNKDPVYLKFQNNKIKVPSPYDDTCCELELDCSIEEQCR